MSDSATRTPYLLCALLGLGGLFFGVTGPLLSNFIPPMVRGVLGEERTLIGLVLALDNVIMFVLVPWSGSLSDRFQRPRAGTASHRPGRARAGRGRHGGASSSPALGLAACWARWWSSTRAST
jgi:MFS family permease